LKNKKLFAKKMKPKWRTNASNASLRINSSTILTRLGFTKRSNNWSYLAKNDSISGGCFENPLCLNDHFLF